MPSTVVKQSRWSAPEETSALALKRSSIARKFAPTADDAPEIGMNNRTVISDSMFTSKVKDLSVAAFSCVSLFQPCLAELTSENVNLEGFKGLQNFQAKWVSERVLYTSCVEPGNYQPHPSSTKPNKSG